ncbi:FtsW/RodA/SpoVE family cell cycle protein [Caulobacter segnis]|uniref:FtsW/RodA/SpoVE family cell cycle protein n=1 Tax=Caulobacter segnis TaxID=88688 RepID=UPI0024107D84|nr:FtsW/RodA/SpoVE family cell cycle protein [Caulobacter segnis]MDG2520920.1 FtsW/RodA/SpoVE family cell cycle protein [Caulobacter segnis]
MTGGAARRVWGLVALLLLLTLAASLLAIRAAGAPSLMLAVQGVAGVAAAASIFIVSRVSTARSAAVMGVGLAAFAATALFGVTMDGATRWIGFGPLLVHTASIGFPFVVWAFALRPATLLTAALCAGIAAVLAIQPDGGAAVAFALATAVRLAAYRGRLDMAAAAVAIVAAAWAWTRPDSLPAVSYVEEVVFAAFMAAPPVGLFAGLMLALLPAPFVFLGLKQNVAPALTLGGLWAGFVLASVFGNYPAPVIGYGASPLLGWGFSLGLAMAHVGAGLRRPAA